MNTLHTQGPVDLEPRSRSDAGCIQQYQLGSIYMQPLLDLDLGHTVIITNYTIQSTATGNIFGLSLGGPICRCRISTLMHDAY